MEHLAIMKKSSGFLEKIILGEKTVESRWYLTKRTPWNKVFSKDIIFFKNSGDPVTVRSKVKKVLQFDNLTPKKIKHILFKFGRALGIEDNEKFFKSIKNKKYCILIFLDNIKFVDPFLIDKTGFGMRSAWISIENISCVKK